MEVTAKFNLCLQIIVQTIVKSEQLARSLKALLPCYGLTVHNLLQVPLKHAMTGGSTLNLDKDLIMLQAEDVCHVKSCLLVCDIH